MFNRILWTLDNEMDGSRFERLCTDLLAREGFKDILPIGGTYDSGRDAEIRRWKGIKSTGGVTFFQYSLEKDWRNKLDRELKKVYGKGHKINFYVFLTSQRVTGESRDKLAKFVTQNYGWQLIVYDREWLRHRLEEAHPDLAAKYLGIPEATAQEQKKSELKPPEPVSSKGEKAWQLYLQKDYERAVVEFKELVKKDRGNVQTWQALAWCQYVLHRYNEALVSINHAHALEEDNDYSLGLKASILTEDGIEKGIKANLLLARDIFKQLAEKSVHWTDHYNYGNVLNALGDYKGAKGEFLKAIENNPKQPEVWKNLGSVYYHLRDHEKEIECYDQALAINSQLPQALLSKGITLLIVFKRAREAAELIERGIEVEESISSQWPHSWYWLAQAYYQQSDIRRALDRVNSGLAVAPSHYGLLNLKSLILSKLWREDHKFVSEAISFFKFRMELFGEDYDTFVELANLYKNMGQSALVRDLVKSYVDLDMVDPLTYLEYSNHDLDNLLSSLRYFSAYKTFRKSETISEYRGLMEKQGISSDDDFENALFIVFSIPFGLVCDVYANLSPPERVGVIEETKNILFDSLKISFPRLSVKLLKTINLNIPEQTSDGLSRIMVVWSDIALLEFSRQLGFIGGYFGLSVQELDKTIANQGGRLGNWQIEIMNDTLFEINKHLKIFKE